MLEFVLSPWYSSKLLSRRCQRERELLPSFDVNINYRLPIKVYYRICNLRHIRIEINHGNMNVFWVLRSHDFFHKNKLPYICSMYDLGFKVLSMKITTSSGSIFSWKTSWLLFHAMNQGRVANFHGPCNEGMRGSLFSWASDWYLCLCLNGSHDVFHENKLPYICSMYDTGFKVLSMKINYFAPFKHKHKH
jgi:hypothetical protein